MMGGSTMLFKKDWPRCERLANDFAIGACYAAPSAIEEYRSHETAKTSSQIAERSLSDRRTATFSSALPNTAASFRFRS
jgi:hypothetical protein